MRRSRPARATVRIGEIDGSAVVKNSNGDTWIGVVAGDLRRQRANGNIAVDARRPASSPSTANGDVRLGEVARARSWLETTIGDLEVGIREGTAAWLDLHTPVRSVHNALDAADAPEASDETVEVRARTSFGDIVIRRP